MIYMLTAWYPPKDANAVLDAMKSVPKLPDYIKKWQIFGTAEGEMGIKVYNLIMVEKGKSDEAAIFIVKMQQHFVDNVEGYKYKIEVLMGVKDSMKVLS